jgi:hypothetical protein
MGLDREKHGSLCIAQPDGRRAKLVEEKKRNGDTLYRDK